jgi:hypothetical protein
MRRTTMAMFENEGFCPRNNFTNFSERQNNKNSLSDKTLKILGDRTHYMVYNNDFFNKDIPYSSVVEVFLGENNTTLGLEVACVLRELIPECVYNKIGKKILIRDSTYKPGIPNDCKRYSGESNIVYLREKDNIIEMYIY